MNRLVYRIVERLRQPGAPLSRNRHYATFAAPEGRQALGIHRELRSLERELLADDADVRLERVEGAERVRLRIHRPKVRVTRTAFLTEEELELLMRSPTVGGVVQAAPWHDDPDAAGA